MVDNYKQCLQLLKGMTGRELCELQHSVAQHIYAKGVEEYIQNIHIHDSIVKFASK